MLRSVACIALLQVSSVHINEVPNMELVALQSDPICSSAGCTEYGHPKPPKGHPMDYFVPNFGPDNEIAATKKSLEIAQALTNHTWVFPKANFTGNPADKAHYNFDPKLDDDIKVSAKNL